jgi:hypothetical protein
MLLPSTYCITQVACHTLHCHKHMINAASACMPTPTRRGGRCTARGCGKAEQRVLLYILTIAVLRYHCRTVPPRVTQQHRWHLWRLPQLTRVWVYHPPHTAQLSPAPPKNNITRRPWISIHITNNNNVPTTRHPGP